MKKVTIKFLPFILIGFTRAVQMSTPKPPAKETGRFCSDASDCYIAVKETQVGTGKSWLEAQEICRNYNSTLPIVDSPARLRGFTDALKNLTLLDNYFWIAANASEMGGTTWRWLDGRKYNGSISFADPWSFNRSYAYIYVNQSIGSLNSTMQLIASSPAPSAYMYICQFLDSDRNDCSYKSGNACYVVYRETLTWFSARNNCLEAEGDLACLLDDTFPRSGDLLTLLRNLPDISGPLRFWIGLRSSWWNWRDATTESDVSEDVTYSYWNYNQPDANSAQCLSTDVLSDGMYNWRDWDCTLSLPFICQVKQNIVSSRTPTIIRTVSHSTKVSSETTHSTTATNESSAQKDQSGTTPSIIPLAVGIGVGVGAPLLIAVIVIIVVLSIKQKRKWENTNTSRSTKVNGRDSKDNNSKPANQHPAEGAYAFVTPQGNASELQPAPTKHSGAAAAVYEGISFNDEPM